MTMTDTSPSVADATPIHASELRQLRLEDPRTRILDVLLLKRHWIQNRAQHCSTSRY